MGERRTGRQEQRKSLTDLSDRLTKITVGFGERTLAAVQLYRRAGKFLDAARTVYDVGNFVIC